MLEAYAGERKRVRAVVANERSFDAAKLLCERRRRERARKRRLRRQVADWHRSLGHSGD